MKIKTSELTGAALDWAVAKCEGQDSLGGFWRPEYSTDWAQGGPIMEQEKICITEWDINTKLFSAESFKPYAKHACQSGSTPLIAAMRCYVASKIGDEVDVPSEFSNG